MSLEEVVIDFEPKVGVIGARRSGKQTKRDVNNCCCSDKTLRSVGGSLKSTDSGARIMNETIISLDQA